jgi:hypothetical protein
MCLQTDVFCGLYCIWVAGIILLDIALKALIYASHQRGHKYATASASSQVYQLLNSHTYTLKLLVIIFFL